MVGWTELLTIFSVVLLLFGGQRMPELARPLGRASREFKNARDGIVDDLIREPRENAETVKTSGEECGESGKPLDQGK